ncbi:PDR/VanB family oxidoreductase [Achromobacter pestifer]|uniref:Phthalate 4,5-dioxygenase oxygenase reductase subunit n=1 Tax=Achromobacter pestifer TaxID=1353889 RepID=A0A6S6YS87_9BURK|nr:PDR/VanB family oxidoreductase [Achromobacter pestifer]CAB3634472.1 Phthalate 4,5-dioxygenase oxygenase reductase subunit [Achromobacter pestifer]
MNAPLPDGALCAAYTAGESLTLRVRCIRWQAEGIHAFELVHPEGIALPEVEAGAHVDVHLPAGVIRSYSLAGDPEDRSCWTLGVLLEASSRGGSRAMHESVRVGQTLTIGWPRNAFRLAPGAAHTVLLAGGIGITPLKAMAHVLASQSASFELHYCARTRQHAAFVDELRALATPARLHLHHDNGERAKGLDIGALLANAPPGTHVYFCGPAGFMDACADAAKHWPEGTVHSEHFKAPARPQTDAAPAGSFEVQLARSGATVQVLPEQTIVRALELAGHRIPTSCLSGLCGACKLEYLEGEVDHQDFILSDEEKTHCLTACVSRAKGARLVVDL